MGPVYIAAAVIGAAAAAVGGLFSAYQLCLLVQADAKRRGLKRPRIRGPFPPSGDGGSGILFYLVVHRKYPILSRSAEQTRFMERCKRNIGTGLACLAAGVILCVLCVFLPGLS